MCAQIAKWLLKLIIVLHVISDSYSLVHLYEYLYYNGFLGTFDLENQPCVTLPSLLRYNVRSLDNTDDCIMAYTGYNCEGYSYRFRKGAYQSLQSVSHTGGPKMHNQIVSIGRCKSSSDTRATHVQFYKGNELVFEIKNLCKKVSISLLISKATWIDNHESCVRLYLRAGTTLDLLPGKSYYSEDIRKFIYLGRIFYHSIYMISPCDLSKPCSIPTVLSASVIHFEVTEPKKKTLAKTSDLSMAATTTFINDGYATVSQEYTATKKVTEATEITRIGSFSIMNNWHVGVSLEAEVKAGSLLYGFEASIKTSLSSSYTTEESATTGKSETKRYETTKEFSTTQKIEIEPCTKYKVDSYVRVKERYPLMYTVTFEVTGKKGDTAMTVTEIRKELGKLNYIRNKDAYTVVATETSEIFLDFGVETIISGEGEIIIECRDNQLKTRPAVSYLNVSLSKFNMSLENLPAHSLTNVTL